MDAERRRESVEHPVDVHTVRWVIIDGNLDSIMHTTLLGVAPGLNRELLAYRDVRHKPRDAPPCADDVRDSATWRERHLIAV